MIGNFKKNSNETIETGNSEIINLNLDFTKNNLSFNLTNDMLKEIEMNGNLTLNFDVKTKGMYVFIPFEFDFHFEKKTTTKFIF